MAGSPKKRARREAQEREYWAAQAKIAEKKRNAPMVLNEDTPPPEYDPRTDKTRIASIVRRAEERREAEERERVETDRLALAGKQSREPGASELAVKAMLTSTRELFRLAGKITREPVDKHERLVLPDDWFKLIMDDAGDLTAYEERARTRRHFLAIALAQGDLNMANRILQMAVKDALALKDAQNTAAEAEARKTEAKVMKQQVLIIQQQMQPEIDKTQTMIDGIASGEPTPFEQRRLARLSDDRATNNADRVGSANNGADESTPAPAQADGAGVDADAPVD